MSRVRAVQSLATSCVCGLMLACLAGISGCGQRKADESDCRAIFDRIVEVELREMGFRDPALAERRQAELAERHRGLIAQCVGRSLPAGAMECVARADTTEEISHDCLR